VMIDSLVTALENARRSPILGQLGVKPGRYALLTLHRPANVDDRERLLATLQAVAQIARELPVVFPVHPRTAAKVAELKIEDAHAWDQSVSIGSRGIWLLPPASYLDFLCLMESSVLVMTDSGGVQEETTYLGIPCLTYRENTERPVTVSLGTNRLVGSNPETLIAEALRALAEASEARPAPAVPLWDGHAAERIVVHVRRYLETSCR
jgi:UDP-N-acetylglucosamine 2-epimerase (non-hydrolysing)